MDVSADAMSETRLEKFQQAYKNLDLFPLIESKDIDKFRVDYGRDVQVRLRQEINASALNGKFVFAGHRGCGKSTLLKQVSVDMQSSHAVVFFSIADQIEMSAVTHTNILYSIAIQLLSYASKQKINVSEDVRETLLGWNSTVRKQVSSEGTKGSMGFGTKALQIIDLSLKQEKSFRDDLEKTFSKKISDLVQKCDRVAAAIQTVKKQPVLVIIDDLDKLDLPLAEAIFRNNIKSLFSPGFRIVFTVPIAAIRETKVLSALHSEGIVRPRLFPVAKFFSKENRHVQGAEPDAKYVDTFVELIHKRIPEGLIEPETARRIVLMSGGVVREIVRLARECCLECMVQIDIESDDVVTINQETLKIALRNLRNDFARQIGSDLYKLMATVYETAETPDARSEEFTRLLHGLMVLEYENDSIWYDIHPIVIELLKQKQLIES
ncbi:MAG: P-loop NTPase fold protein [Cyanobacteria bacterium P01_D01_bin.156]